MRIHNPRVHVMVLQYMWDSDAAPALTHEHASILGYDCGDQHLAHEQALHADAGLPGLVVACKQRRRV